MLIIFNRYYQVLDRWSAQVQDCVHNVKREHAQHQVGQVSGNSDDDHLDGGGDHVAVR